MVNLTFKELKEYFSKGEHPEKVGNEFMLVHSVKFSAQLLINDIERELKTKGEEGKKTRVSKVAKSNLQRLYEICVDTSKNDIKKFEKKAFSNYVVLTK